MTKHILITGGAGFLGSHLCRRLLKEGNKVDCVDNLITGNIKNIQDIQSNSKFTFIQKDLIKINDQNWFEIYDEIYHLASPASPPLYKKYWLETIFVNTQGTFNILKNINKNTKFLFASTSEVFGDPDPKQIPIKEEYYGNVNCFGERSCYDEAKRLGETLCYEFIKNYRHDIKIARIHNTYGPSMDINDGRVIITFIQQALQNKDITVFGDGTHYRCFTFVDDMIEALIRLMDSNTNTPINLGSHFQFSIFETAKIIKELTGSKSQITFHPIDKDDPKERKPDLTKAKEILKWEAQINFHTGLLEMIDYVKKEMF